MIWSARLWHDTGKTVAWLIANDIPFHGVMMQKGATDCYIDDKAIVPSPEEFIRILNGDIETSLCEVKR